MVGEEEEAVVAAQPVAEKVEVEKEVEAFLLLGTEATSEEEVGDIAMPTGEAGSTTVREEQEEVRTAQPEEKRGATTVPEEDEAGAVQPEEEGGGTTVREENGATTVQEAEVGTAQTEEEAGATTVREEEEVGAAEALAYEFKRREQEYKELPIMVVEVGEDFPIRAPSIISLNYVGCHHDNLNHEAIEYFIKRGKLR